MIYCLLTKVSRAVVIRSCIVYSRYDKKCRSSVWHCRVRVLSFGVQDNNSKMCLKELATAGTIQSGKSNHAFILSSVVELAVLWGLCNDLGAPCHMFSAKFRAGRKQ